MSLQRKYHRALQEYCAAEGISFEDGVEVLRQKVEESGGFTDHWGVGRAAKDRSHADSVLPVWVWTNTATTICERGCKPAKSGRAELGLRPKRVEASKAQLNISDLRLRAEYRLPETPSTKLVMAAFGLEGETVHFDIVQGVSATVSGGNIILVAGSSGSGKTVAASGAGPHYAQRERCRGRHGDGQLHHGLAPTDHRGSSRYSKHWHNDIPTERTFGALSRVGLSDALVFVKPFWMLSRGQQYRAMIAELLLGEDGVWLLDEFCGDLDPITAKVVAHNLRKQIVATGRVAFVASANHLHYVDALRPTRVLSLRAGDEARWLTYRAYREEMTDS